MSNAVKDKKYYRKLYRKYKRKSIETTNNLREVERQLAAVEGQLTAAKTRLGRIEHDSAMNVRKEMDLYFMEVDGSKPILWINTSDPKLANAATFANIRDRLSRLAPGIEMIILTYGDLRLWEMDAKDLEKIGLARIQGHTGGTVGKDVPRLEHK